MVHKFGNVFITLPLTDVETKKDSYVAIFMRMTTKPTNLSLELSGKIALHQILNVLVGERVELVFKAAGEHGISFCRSFF